MSESSAPLPLALGSLHHRGCSPIFSATHPFSGSTFLGPCSQPGPGSQHSALPGDRGWQGSAVTLTGSRGATRHGLHGQSGFLLRSGRLLTFQMLGIVLRDFTSEEGYVHSRQLCNTTGSGALKLLNFAGRSEFLMTPWLCQRRRWQGCPQSLLGHCLLGGALPSSSLCGGP